MSVLMRRRVLSVAVAVILAFTAALSAQVRPAQPGANIYVNPNAAMGRAASAGAGGGLLGYGSLAPNRGMGSLSASYANPGLGYGTLANNSSSNPNSASNSSYGMYGTQWMMNPYQGYLSAAADFTRANAAFDYNIQQARLAREESRRSVLKTRRAIIEERLWEREHMPDPEKIRQRELARELDRARFQPPLDDIRSARSLNALLRHLMSQQARGIAGDAVPIPSDTLKHINYTVGTHSGNIGLLRDSGNLDWPLSLQGEAFKSPRQTLAKLMMKAYDSVKGGAKPDTEDLDALQDNLDNMKKILDAEVASLSNAQVMQAAGYLKHVKAAITALNDSSVTNFFNQNWIPNGGNVGELVDSMRKKGLWFAPATPADTRYYRSLYHALASFDAHLRRSGSLSEK